MGSKRAKMGVRDWDMKMHVASRLLGGFSKRDLADLVYPRDLVAASQAYDNFRKWHKALPIRSDGPKEFFDALASKLECHDVTGIMIVESDIERFISYLPLKHQQRAIETLEDFRQQEVRGDDPVPVIPIVRNSSNVNSIHGVRFRAMMYLQDGNIPSLRDGIIAGRINQEHYYLNNDAAITWHKLVRAEAYPTYDQCKAGLRALMDTPAWMDAVTVARPTSVIMLGGGGAPTKDLVLLNNLISHPALSGSKISYFIVDVSSYMLKASTVWLSESLREVAGAERVEIIEHWQDMMELKGCSDDFRRGGSAVFAITGGTIGNVSEQAFFNSVDAISHPGDLLIISADTIDGAPSSIVEKDLLKKYDHPGMRRFVAPSIHALIGEMKLSESSESIFERLQISLSPAKKAGLSDVDDSYAVTLCVEAGGRNVTLLSSTRYRYAYGQDRLTICRVTWRNPGLRLTPVLAEVLESVEWAKYIF